MFSLVIAIIAIALVVASVVASGYFGGHSVTDAQAISEAARLRSEEQQILGAMDLFNSDYRRWPNNVQELVDTGFLRSAPKGFQPGAALSRDFQFELLPLANAAAGDISGWTTPLVQQPIFWTAAIVPKQVCQQYNLATRGDDGILIEPFDRLSSQCFGTEGRYRVVVGKMGPSVPSLTVALAPLHTQIGGLPAASAGEGWWAEAPTGPLVLPVDPDKGAVPALQVHGAAALGAVQLGERLKSPALTLSNVGSGLARNLQIAAPQGFTVVDSSCGAQLGINASCNFAVEFAPVAAETYTGDLTVRAEGVDAIRSAVSGSGLKPNGVFSSGDFGAIIGGHKSVLDITLKNTGLGPLTILSAVVAPGYFTQVEGGTCGAVLAVNASCNYKVELWAGTGPKFSGTLTVTAAGNVNLVADLSGEITPARFTVSPYSYDFRNVMVGYPLVGPTHVVTNQGTAPGIVAIGALPSGYTLVGSTCANQVPAKGTCSFALSLKPTVVGQAYNGEVKLTSGGVEQGKVVVQGSGAAASLITQGSMVFGTVTAGTQGRKQVTLRNVSSSTIPLPSAASMYSFSGPGFSLYSSTCGSQLTPNQTGNAACLITVAYDSTGPAPAVTGYLFIDTGIGILQAPMTVTPK